MKPWNTKTQPDPTSVPSEPVTPNPAPVVHANGDVLDQTISVILEGNQELLGDTLAECRKMLSECSAQIKELNATLGDQETPS